MLSHGFPLCGEIPRCWPLCRPVCPFPGLGGIRTLCPSSDDLWRLCAGRSRNRRLSSCIDGFSLSPLAHAAEYADLDAAVKRLDDDFLAPLFTLSEKKRTALIAREIGCGVVPLSEKDRLWRELHGAALAKAAAKADSVIRLFCGLPERLK